MTTRLVRHAALVGGLVAALGFMGTPASASPAGGERCFFACHVFKQDDTQRMYDAALLGRKEFAAVCATMSSNSDMYECEDLIDWSYTLAYDGEPNGQCLGVAWPIWGEQPQFDYVECVA
jgi:hypothetical protein